MSSGARRAMATARSTSRARASADRSEPDTTAWDRPTNTRRPRSRLSSFSTSSSRPSRTETDREVRSAPTASAASAPALRAAATTSSSSSMFIRRGPGQRKSVSWVYGDGEAPAQGAPGAGAGRLPAGAARRIPGA